jgi:phenylacetate-CoA ligase
MEQNKPGSVWAAWNPWAALAPWAQVQRQASAHLVEHRLAALLAHAQRHSPYYRRHWQAGAQGPQDWQSLPPVHKADLMAHFDDWVTDPALKLHELQAFLADPSRIGQDYLGRYAVWTSSGTTGVPGVFVHDAAALAQYATLTTTRRDARDPFSNLMQGLWWAHARSSLIAANDGHYAGISFWLRQCRLHPWMAARSQVLSVTATQASLVADLQAFQPDFLVSYPSVLAELARQQACGELHIAPRLIWAGGERLAASTRAYIESVFDAHVINDYGASECMTIGFECPHGRVHVNDDWVLLEPIDKAGHPVPPGQASHSVLLTNLANHVQPIIRYDLGDSITVETEPCPCGNTRMAIQVRGRCDDSLRMRNPKDAQGHWVHLSPMALTTALEEGCELHRFQLRQTADDALDLRLDLSHEAEPRAKQRLALSVLRQFLSEQGLPHVHLHFDPALPAVEPHSGKLRQVIARVSG